jgi:hypothetical protein
MHGLAVVDILQRLGVQPGALVSPLGGQPKGDACSYVVYRLCRVAGHAGKDVILAMGRVNAVPYISRIVGYYDQQMQIALRLPIVESEVP